MKKRKIAALLLLMILCFALVSCVHNSIGIELGEKEGGKITYTYKVNKTVIDRYFSGKPPERLAQIEQIGTQKYYVATVNVEAATDAELQGKLRSLTMLEESGTTIFSEATVSKNYIKLSTNPNVISYDVESLSTSKGVNIYEHVTLELTLVCPREIEAYAGGELSPDGRTVKLKVKDLSQAHTLEVLYEKAPPSPWLIFAIVIASIVGAAGIALTITLYVLYRKRKAAEAMPDRPIDQI